MAREDRKVTADWQHPVNIDGNLIPMLEPQMADLMKGVRNYFQKYETTTEGAPMSPVFAQAEDLAQWLADREVPLFGHAHSSCNLPHDGHTDERALCAAQQ